MASVPLDQLSAPAIPLVRGPRGRFAMNIGKAVIDASIMDIVSTRPGQRVMRPTYGCAIHALVWEPADAITLNLCKRHISDALKQFEPRIAIDSISVVFDESGDSTQPPAIVGSVFWFLQSTKAGRFETSLGPLRQAGR